MSGGKKPTKQNRNAIEGQMNHQVDYAIRNHFLKYLEKSKLASQIDQCLYVSERKRMGFIIKSFQMKLFYRIKIKKKEKTLAFCRCQ